MADASHPVSKGILWSDATPVTAVVQADGTKAEAVVALAYIWDPNSGAFVKQQAAANATVTAYATSKVIKASPGTLWGLTGHNSNTAAQFIQLHDAACLPADAAVPAVIYSVPGSTSFSLDYPIGRLFTVGIVICNSSTGPTKTIGAADCWFDAQAT